MLLGTKKILLSLLIAFATIVAVDYAIKIISFDNAIDYLQKLAFTIAAFFAAATFLRGELSKLLNEEVLSADESRRLKSIIDVRRSRLTIFLIGCLGMTLLLGLAPFMTLLPEKIIQYLPHILVVGFVELLYFLGLIILSMDEVEKFKDKLMQRAKQDKERDVLLEKLSKK